jgi:predicted nucleic acid-binding protein
VIVVSDTSPLRYLAAVGGMDWLPALFGEVICPPEVITECLHDRAPCSDPCCLSSSIYLQPNDLGRFPPD